MHEAAIENELKGVEWIKISGGRSPFLPWFMATLVSSFSKMMLKINSNSLKYISYTLDKRSYLLYHKLKTLKPVYNIVIAHNPGTFWPVYKYASKNKLPYGVDVEDYHPGEYNNTWQETIARALMNSVLKAAKYVSAASPLILDKTIADTPEIKDRATVLNNVFPLSYQPAFEELKLEPGKALKIVWFSQHIGTNRGVQDILAAANRVTTFPVEITLIGNCLPGVNEEFETIMPNKQHKLIFLQPVNEKNLVPMLSQYHIGIASEPGFSVNNNIALSNKIFSYLLAGNAVIASATDAQKLFMESNPQVGWLYTSGDIPQLKNILETIYNNAAKLDATRRNAYDLGKQQFNWDKEQAIFLNMLNKALA